VVTAGRAESQRETFCELLGRFNVALSEYHSTVGQGPEDGA
jgi:hypothetical protein